MRSQTRSVAEIDVRQELRRVLASPGFSSSERLRCFLTYVVEEALGGNADRIKAYNIATSAFGRGEDFDPQQDSIVRIEAGRLRRALEHFYLSEGSTNGVKISIPKGAYVPEFMEASPHEPEGDPLNEPALHSSINRRGQRIFVATFEHEDQTNDLLAFGSGFSRRLISGLTRFNNLFVFGAETTESLRVTNKGDLSKIASLYNPDFVVSGTLTVRSGRFKLELLMQDALSGQYVWAETFERDLGPQDIYGLLDEIAAEVVRRLAQPYGILFSKAMDQSGRTPESLEHFGAILNFYEYTRRYEKALFEPVRAQLEAVIAEDPGFSEAFACLSMLYSYFVRFNMDLEVAIPDPMGRARMLAEKAILLAPDSSSAHHALAVALWFSGDIDRSMTTYQQANLLNPCDTDIMADLGLRYSLRMNWQKAVPLLEHSYDRNPCQPTTFRIGLFLYHFAEGRYLEALEQAQMIDSPDIVYAHIAVAAAAGELGRMSEAREAVLWIETNVPGYGRRMQADLRARNLHPDLIDALTAALAKAGLIGLSFEHKAKVAMV